MRRFSFVSSGDSIDNDIDDLMKGLYVDPVLLEKKCFDSIGYVGGNRDELAVPSLATLQSDRSAEDVVEDLPLEYFTSDFDPIEGHLIEISSWTGGNIIEKFMNKIEETDTDKDVIIGHLTSMIDENYDDLMACMKNIQSIDVDLCRTGIHISHGRRKIAAACEVVSQGSIKINQLSNKKEKLVGMADTIRSLKALKDIHKAMNNSINLGEVGRAAEHARSVLECLKNDAYDQFAALKSIGSSMQRSILAIRQKSDKSLKRLCSRKFATSEYDSVLQAYLTLDYLSETLKIDISGADEDPFAGADSSVSFYSDSCGCVEGLSQRVNRYQLEDVDACLHSAVMEYIYAAQHKKQKAAAEALTTGSSVGMNYGEMMDLAEVPLNILYRRLSAEVVAPCVIRSCELLADIVHTNYLINQWHSAPFDPRNHDWDYLHRSVLDLNHLHRQQLESEDEEEDEYRSSEEAPAESDLGETKVDGKVSSPERQEKIETPVKSDLKPFSKLLEHKLRNVHVSEVSEETTSSIVSSFEEHFGDHFRQSSPAAIGSDRSMRLNGVRLAVAYQHLAKSRHVLWDELVRALVEMLNLLTVSSATRPDDFLSMVSALHAMMELGREFCGSESRALSLCLQQKSTEYFQHFHIESFQMLRQMVESESWQSVPINLTESGGILGMIKSNLSRDAATSTVLFNGKRKAAQGTKSKAGANRRPSSMRSVQPSSDSAQVTNSSTSSPERLQGCQSMLMRFGSEGNPFHCMNANQEDGGSGEVNESATADQPSSEAQTAAEVDVFWELLMSDGGEESPVRGASKRAHDQTASMVVTQSSLNGLVRYVAKYLHMMHLLPSAAGEIFQSLCQLFDYYLSSVFNGFVPPDERQRCMARPSKLTSGAPDQSRDFQELLSYMERTLDEVVNTGAVTSQTASHGLNGSVPVDRDSASDSGEAGLRQNQAIHGLPAQFEAMKISSLLRQPAVVTFSNSSTCFALNERIVAAESCWFVAMVLSEVKPMMLKFLPSRTRSVCDSYVAQIQLVAGQLRAFVYKAVCPLLIKQATILPLITDCGWESRKLREQSHEWVDQLVENCNEVWEYIMLTDQFAESSSLVREQVWLEVCQCAFDLLLEGYSRARKCSSEGRASMTMDVFALHEGLNNIHLCRPPRGKHHIDSYLRMSYLGEEEMLQFVQDNWQSFAYRHIAGMLTQTLTSVLSSKKLKDAMALIDGLYDVENGAGARDGSAGVAGGNKLSNLLSTRLRDDNKLTKLLSSKFSVR